MTQPRILLVEDNEMNREVLSRRLERKGFEVLTAVDGAAALQAAAKERPGLILMDLSLPTIDGWEASRRLKDDQETAAIPIIALTAHAMSGDRQSAVEAGCDGYETKPVDLPRLLEKIEALLDRGVDNRTAEVDAVRSQRPESRTADPQPSVGATDAVSRQTGRILVVDDNAENRELLVRRLRQDGHTDYVAENGQEGLALLEETEIDLVLLDIMMPVMDGYQVLEQMKKDTQLRHIPVIVVSASQEFDSAVRCIEMGADDYLTKPFNRVLLQARISSSLEKKRLRDQEVRFREQVEVEKKRTDELLHALFPHPVVQELKASNQFRPRRYQNVAVLFSDIVGFTSYCDGHPPEEVIERLQRMIGSFETISARWGLEKIKTIGDAFMATAGLLAPVDDPVLVCVEAGLEMIEAMWSVDAGWQVRVGIHVGPVVAGVVGERQYSLDIWGDTVNTAARVESYGGPGRVNVSGAAWQPIAHKCRGESETVDVKGKGPLEIVRFKSFTGGRIGSTACSPSPYH